MTKDGSEDSVGVEGARLLSLTIERFRNVVPGTTIDFDAGVNVLLGRNGAGKTSLLELVSAIARSDFRAYRRHDFDLAYVIQVGEARFAIHVENVAFSTDGADLPSGIAGERWLYRFELSNSQGRVCAVTVAPGGVSAEPSDDLEVGGMTAPVSLFVPMFYYVQFLMLPMSDRDRNITQELVSQASDRIRRLHSNCIRLDEGLDVLRCVTEGAELRPDLRSTVELRSRGKTTRSAYVPSDVVRLAVGVGESVHSKTELTLEHDDVEILGRLADGLGVTALHMTLGLLERERSTNRGTVQSTYGKPVVRITTRDGSTFTHDALSYGEKRLFAFLWHAGSNPDILVADELVNGLHHEWIQTCLDAIQGQAFLTSQNPLLLDHLTFLTAEEVRGRFVLCDRDDEGNWIWRNMSPDAAGSFFRAYEVGLQHVSEILKTKGLW